MLRPNILNIFNKKIKRKKTLDCWFDKLGGTAYTNCYTPAPDTPRSMACFYTGRYPINNGCFKRAKDPKYSLYDNLFTIFDLFEEKDYHITSYIEKAKYDGGFFPDNDCIKPIFDFEKYVAGLKKDVKEHKDLASFVILSDYHWAIDDYGGNSKGDYLGQKEISKCLKKIFSNTDPDDFDKIVIFSDHGFKTNYDRLFQDKIKHLDDDRSKITLFIRDKNDISLKKDNRLISIMDILPTFCNILNIEKDYDFDGFSIIKDIPKDRSIILEDYIDFLPDIDKIHKIWAIRKTNEFYFETFDNGRLDNMYLLEKGVNDYRIGKIDKEKKRKYQEDILRHTYSYPIVKEFVENSKRYQNMKKRPNSYTCGKRRIDKNKMLNKIKKIKDTIIYRNKL